MRSPIALSALSLLISSTLAAPLLGSAGSTSALFGSVKSVTDTKVTADIVSHVNGLMDLDLVAKGVIKGDAELKVFIDLMVSVVSGAKHHAYTDAKIIASLAAKLKFDAFAKWSTDVCIGSYHKDAVCTELSGYIAAAYYAYITGSAGADLFAAIGSARVDRWHTVLDGICSIPTAHHQSCDLVYASFDAWVAAAAKVDIVAVTATRARLDSFNLFASLDAYAKTTITAASATTAHVSRSNDNVEERGLGGAGNVFGAVHGTVASVTKLKLGKDGLALGSITGVAADGTLLVDGLLLTDVLAHYDATLDSDTFLSLNKGTLYLFSKTTAAVDSFAGIKLGKRILGEIVAGAKAKVDAAVAGSLDKHGLRLGAVTGLAADGVLLVDGKLLPEVLAVAGIKLDSVTKGFLQITKDGLYLFGSSYTDASAIGGGSVTLRRGLPVAPAAPVAKVVSATGTRFDSTGKLVIDKDGFYLGTITGASADGILLIDGVLLPEVLASYGLDLKNGNFVKIGKGGLYFYSGTSASAGASGKVLAREMEERLVDGLEATQVLDGAAAAVVEPIKGKGHGYGHGVAGLKLDVVTDLVTKLGVKL